MLAEIKKPFHEYAPGEDVPLTGYAGIMVLYAGVLGLVLLGITRKARWQPPLTDVVLLGIATHKLSRIVSKDFVTAPIRAPFARRKGKEGAGEVQDEAEARHPLAQSLGFLLTCPYCLGPWVATGLSAVLAWRPVQTRFVLRMLGAVTMSDFLHLAYSRLNESRKEVLAERRRLEHG